MLFVTSVPAKGHADAKINSKSRFHEWLNFIDMRIQGTDKDFLVHVFRSFESVWWQTEWVGGMCVGTDQGLVVTLHHQESGLILTWWPA